MTALQLQALAQGQSITQQVSNGTQTVVVQSTNQPNGACFDCEDSTCEVEPTQAVSLDNARFSRTNASKLRWNFDTRPLGVLSEQHITLMSNRGPENFLDYPSLDLFLPAFGYEVLQTGLGATRSVLIGTTVGSSAITSVGLFSQGDVGSLIFDPTGVPAPPTQSVDVGTIIIAVTDANNATISTLANVTGAVTVVFNNPMGASQNGALINGEVGGPLIAQLNKILSGGSVIGAITVRFDNSVAANAALGSLPITLFHLPVDSNDTVINTTIYDPFCDFCATTNTGTFTTHRYTFNGPTTFRDGVDIEIPDNTFGTLEICYGIINLPNTMADTAQHQWL